MRPGAVAEEASFTAAAQRVHVAQQVLSGRGIGIAFIVARGGAGWPTLIADGVTAAPAHRLHCRKGIRDSSLSCVFTPHDPGVNTHDHGSTWSRQEWAGSK